MKLRRLLVTIHLWVGMAAAPFLFILGATGALLVFEDQIDDAANARIVLVTPSGPALPLDELERRVVAAHPGTRVIAGALPGDAVHAAAFVLAGDPPGADVQQVFVDPYTGRQTGTAADLRQPMGPVHQLHTRLLAGHAGNLVVGWAAVLLLFLSVSGLILWWPGKIIRVTWEGTLRRISFDLHNALGAYAWVFLALFAFSGIVIHWNEWASGPGPRGVMTGEVSDCAGGTPKPFSEVVRIAAAAMPGATVTFSQPMRPGSGQVLVHLRYPEDHTPAGRTMVTVGECSGRVLSAVSTRDMPARYRFARMTNRSIHTGDIFGWPTRILAALMSLTLPLMAVTGPLIWWTRRRARA